MGQKSADAGQRTPVTIYMTGPMGAIAKVEGFLTGVTAEVGGTVSYVPKRGRREKMIMTYYSSFIMVVQGWNKPEPDGGFLPAEPGSTPGVSVSRGRYRGHDPRWVTDFLEGPGKGLIPIVLFQDGRLVKDNSGLRVASLHAKVLRFAAELPAGSAERKTLLHILATDTSEPRGVFAFDSED